MRPRPKLAIALVIALTLVLVPQALAGGLSKKRALKETGRVAKRAAIQTGGVYWFAGACKSKSARKVVCWGGVAYSNGTGCVQQVVVRKRGHAVTANRHGRVYCGRLPGSGGGGGGSGSSGDYAICAIHQSVCIRPL